MTIDGAREREAELIVEEQYDASDKKTVNNARKKGARLERERLEFVQAIMSTAQGRKWMYDLMVMCNVFGNPLVPMDTHATYFHLGMQNVGKKLLQDVGDAAPDEYTLMLKEAKNAK